MALVGIGFVLMALAVQSRGSSVTVAQTSGAGETTSAMGGVAGTVEVPSVSGKRLADARLVLDAAGFKVSVSRKAEATAASGTVLTQAPAAGTLVAVGSQMSLVVAGSETAASPRVASSSGMPAKARQLVVVIDPGHQARSDQSLEPVGPGSSVKKAKSSGGATGGVTQIPEYEIALQISTNLAARLRHAGVKVIMTRTTNDVALSNSQRATIANRADADLFVRVHANVSTDERVTGISTLYPASNRWCRPFSAASEAAAKDVQASVLAATEAANDGIRSRSDLAGFNYARVPSVLVECGYLTNSVEDRLLASPHYQDKISQGIANGVLAYLKKTR